MDSLIVDVTFVLFFRLQSFERLIYRRGAENGEFSQRAKQIVTI